MMGKNEVYEWMMGVSEGGVGMKEGLIIRFVRHLHSDGTAKSILIASTARRIEVEAYERFVLEDSERILLPWGFEMFTAKRLTVDHRDMYDIRPHLDITQVFSQCQSLEQAEM